MKYIAFGLAVLCAALLCPMAEGGLFARRSAACGTAATAACTGSAPAAASGCSGATTVRQVNRTRTVRVRRASGC